MFYHLIASLGSTGQGRIDNLVVDDMSLYSGDKGVASR